MLTQPTKGNYKASMGKSNNNYNKIRLMRMFSAPNTSTSVQTLAADAHLAERQFLHEEQTLNDAKATYGLNILPKRQRTFTGL
jgi:hypothetical protein